MDKNPGVLKSLAHTTGGERFLPRSPGELLTRVRAHRARDSRRLHHRLRAAGARRRLSPRQGRDRSGVGAAAERPHAPRLLRRGADATAMTRQTHAAVDRTRADRRRRRPRGLVRRDSRRGAVPPDRAAAAAAHRHADRPARRQRRPEGGASAGARPAGTLLGRLEAPSVKLSTAVLEGSDDATLSRGSGHIEDTPFPGQPGNVGHRRPSRHDVSRAAKHPRRRRARIQDGRPPVSLSDQQDLDRRARRRLRARPDAAAGADAGDLLSVRVRRPRAAALHRARGFGGRRSDGRQAGRRDR